ncbi:hypothetical protein D6783_03350, partial [Candidatus Woesearchaeota archaeon]
PSQPGLRLQKKLEENLSQLSSVTRLSTEVTSFQADHTGWLQSVQTDKLRIPGKRFLLATGQWIGRGLFVTPELSPKERIFGLPLQLPSSYTKDASDLFFELHTPCCFLDVRKKHPFFSLGLTVDERWRPLDQGRQPVFFNLLAAGSIVSNLPQQLPPSSSTAHLYQQGYEAANTAVNDLRKKKKNEETT